MTTLLQPEPASPSTASESASAAIQSDAPRELKSLLHNAGAFSLDGKGWIRITGGDRVRWLNGMVTNSIQQLQPGQGCYNFILSAQGRIQGDCYAFAQPDCLLLETGRSQIAPLLALLDRFIIMDDVELHDESEQWSGIGLAGPQAAAVLERLNLHAIAPEHAAAEQMAANEAGIKAVQLTPLQLDGFGEVRLIAAYSPGVSRFEVWLAPHIRDLFKDQLVEQGATPCGSQSVEWLRILEGIPSYGADIRDKDLPQETAQTHALHFSKGCYIGQEIVERIRSRGNVHRTFIGLRLHGAPAPPGTLLEADGQKAGEITSCATIPLDGVAATLALGYIRREALDRKATLRYIGSTPPSTNVTGSTATGNTAEAVALPFSAA